MGDLYTDILIHITPGDSVNSYEVRADLDDGSRFHGGDLQIDLEELRAQEFDPQAYGLNLFYRLMSGPIRRAYDKITGRAEAEAKGQVRVRLWIDDRAAELHALPWERLHHLQRGQEIPLTTSPQTPFSRYTGLEIAEAEPISNPPLNLLFVLSNPSNLPTGLQPIQVEQEVSSWLDALKDPLQNGQVQVSLIPGHSGLSAELQSRLQQLGVKLIDGVSSLPNILRVLPGHHVLHFLGHGHFKRTDPSGPGEAALFLEKDNGEFQAARDTELVNQLSATQQLPHLIFLAACETAKREFQTEHPFVGLGPKLVAAGVPAVVAMQDLVPMDLARQLTADFYSELLTDGFVDRALNRARLLLFNHEKTDWAIPILFMRLTNGKLIDFSDITIERLPFEPETVHVPAGPFTMGASTDTDPSIDETPEHEVTLPEFRIGKYPITNAEYHAFIRQSKEQEPPRKTGWFLREPPKDKLDHPVVGVSWHDARSYCEWLSEQTGRAYRLPTEAEWEKAARGTDSRAYPWGTQWDAQNANTGSADTTPVGAFPDGRSPNGCQDLVGNVQEWTSTLWGEARKENTFPYPYQPLDGREDLDADRHLTKVYRIHRGGSYSDSLEKLKTYARNRALAKSATRERGFRIVLALPGEG